MHLYSVLVQYEQINQHYDPTWPISAIIYKSSINFNLQVQDQTTSKL